MKINFALLAVLSGLLVNSTPLFASEMDDRIEAAARKSYVFKTYLKDDSIKTESKNGVVILTGTVTEAFHRDLAQNTVEGLPGVTSVDNRLQIKGESPAERSDTWISMKVKTAFLFHRNVSASETEVSVKDGVVSLRGTATSLAQKELTAEYARDIEGVKEVKNELTLVASPARPKATLGETIDDASITAQVKLSLLSHRSTHALKTKVATIEGVVTVTGLAKSLSEKNLVTRLVMDVHGVNSVINNMTIAALLIAN